MRCAGAPDVCVDCRRHTGVSCEKKARSIATMIPTAVTNTPAAASSATAKRSAHR
jgi:hypothetical protein